MNFVRFYFKQSAWGKNGTYGLNYDGTYVGHCQHYYFLNWKYIIDIQINLKQGGRGEISIGGAQQKLDKSSFIFPNFSLMSNNTFKISANDALTWLLFYFWKTVHIACIYKNSLE